MPVIAVVFDLYGTLADVIIDEASAARWQSLALELRRSGVAVDETGVELRKQFEELCATAAAAGQAGRMLPWVFRQMLRAAGIDGSPDQVANFGKKFREATTESLELRDYARPLISGLKSCGMRIGLLSNTEALVTRFDLERLHVADLFDAIVLSSEAGSEKPSTEVFRIVLDRLGARPGESAMVGDSWSADVVGALLVGMRALCLDEHAASGRVVSADNGALSVHPDLPSIVGGLRALEIPLAPPD
jgi:putative hydrolase of the HAD superfamily